MDLEALQAKAQKKRAELDRIEEERLSPQKENY